MRLSVGVIRRDGCLTLNLIHCIGAACVNTENMDGMARLRFITCGNRLSAARARSCWFREGARVQLHRPTPPGKRERHCSDVSRRSRTVVRDRPARITAGFFNRLWRSGLGFACLRYANQGTVQSMRPLGLGLRGWIYLRTYV